MLQNRYKNSKKHEKMFNIISYQGNANSNYNKIWLMCTKLAKIKPAMITNDEEELNFLHVAD
jgi:hypothetical protein